MVDIIAHNKLSALPGGKKGDGTQTLNREIFLVQM